jgi:hypothetical protein
MKYFSIRVRNLPTGRVVELGVIKADCLQSAQRKAMLCARVHNSQQIVYVSELTALDLKLKAIINKREEPIPARLQRMYESRMKGE